MIWRCFTTLALLLLLVPASYAQGLQQINNEYLPATFDKAHNLCAAQNVIVKTKKTHLLKRAQLASLAAKKSGRRSVNDIQWMKYKNVVAEGFRVSQPPLLAADRLKANNVSSWLDDGINVRISDKALLSLDTNFSGSLDVQSKDMPILADMKTEDRDLEVNFSLLVNMW